MMRKDSPRREDIAVKAIPAHGKRLCRRAEIAIVYDFDGTLSPGAMQEYSILPALGLDAASFWREVGEDAERNAGDSMLSYLRIMMEKARERGIPLTRGLLAGRAGAIRYFQGVESWFGRMNEYVESKSGGRATLKHYIISCGNRDRSYLCAYSRRSGEISEWRAAGVIPRPSSTKRPVWRDRQAMPYNKSRKHAVAKTPRPSSALHDGAVCRQGMRLATIWRATCRQRRKERKEESDNSRRAKACSPHAEIMEERSRIHSAAFADCAKAMRRRIAGGSQ